MHRSKCSGAAILAILASQLVGCAAVAQAPQEAPQEVATAADQQELAEAREVAAQYVQAWQAANHLVRTKQFSRAYSLISDLMAASLFEALPSGERHAWVYAAADLGREMGDFKRAHPLFLSASEMPEAGIEDWAGRYEAAGRLDDSQDATYALATIARRWPESLDRFSSRYVRRFALGWGATKADEETRMKLLEALFAANWKVDYGVEPSALWIELARMQAERGNAQRAADLVGRVTDPRDVLALRVDKRFESLVRAQPQRFDVAAAMERNLADWRDIALRNPRKLEATAELASRCQDNGRYDEALNITNEVIARVAAEKKPGELYDDLNEQINWIHDVRAHALWGLGRWDDAEREQLRAAGLLEKGHANVSNAINLAHVYVKLDRSGDALKALGPRLRELADVSGYGAMQVHYVLHAVAVSRKDGKAARESLDYMREHQAETLGTFQESLLVAGDLDEAAALLVQRLEDRELRAAALAEVQEYQEAALSPFEKRVRDGWRQLRQRDDVRAAVASVGSIGRFPLPPG